MKTKNASKLMTVLSIISLCFIMSSTAQAGWYWAKMKNVAPASGSGDTFVQFTPGKKPDGSNETQFSGVARGIVQNSDTGANKVMAVLLTAI